MIHDLLAGFLASVATFVGLGSIAPVSLTTEDENLRIGASAIAAVAIGLLVVVVA